MATNYPSSLDSFTNPTATDTLDSATVPHAAQHDNLNDAVKAVETALGANLVNVVLPARSISTTAPIAGGGDLSANRTLSLNIGSSLTTSSSNLIVDSTVVPYLANANTFTASPQQITVNAAGNKGLIIKAAASQTANLQEWQDSAGTLLFSISSGGDLNASGTNKAIRISYLQNVGGTGAFIDYTNTSNSLTVLQRVAAAVGLIVKGAASQTANLQQWQNSSSTILAGANALGQSFTGSTAPILVATGGATTAASGDGTTATITTTSAHGLAVGDLVTIAGVTPTGYNATALLTAVTSTTISYLNATTGAQTIAGTVSAPAQASVTARSAGSVGLIVKPATGQVSNITEWYNSSGVLISWVRRDGLIAGQMQSPTIIGGTIAKPNSATGIPIVVQGFASQTANLQEWQNSAGTVLTSILAAGTINFASGNTATTATAGAVTAPALVTGFITMQVAGTTVKVPYYSN